MPKNRRILNYPVLIMVATVGLVAAGALLLWSNRIPQVIRSAARAQNVDESLFYEATELLERASKNHRFSDADWGLAERLTRNSNRILVGYAVRAMGETTDPPGRARATAKLQSLVGEPRLEDSYDLLYALRKIGSSRWRDYATRIIAKESSANQEIAKTFLLEGDWHEKK